MLKLQNICFRYSSAEHHIIRNLNFSAGKGEIIAILGDSGSGKTTLLNIICGVIPKIIKGEFCGQVWWNDKNINELTLPQTAPHISLLMQEPDNQLFFPTVEQELAFGAENLNIPPLEIRYRLDESLYKLGIDHLRKEATNTLSFGQKKLVTFASLLTLSPTVFLLDEISAGLSEKHLKKVIEIIHDLAQAGKIIFLAEHHSEIMKIADRFIKLG